MATTFTFSLQAALDAARHHAESCERAFALAARAEEVERQRLSNAVSDTIQAKARYELMCFERSADDSSVRELQSAAIQRASQAAYVKRCEQAVLGRQRALLQAEADKQARLTALSDAVGKVSAFENLRDRHRQEFLQGRIQAEDAETEEAVRQQISRRPSA